MKRLYQLPQNVNDTRPQQQNSTIWSQAVFAIETTVDQQPVQCVHFHNVYILAKVNFR